MKKNIYYRNVLQRENQFKKTLFSIFQTFASPARLLLEVFIRKDFGERYFRLSTVISITVFLALFPIVLLKSALVMQAMFSRSGMMRLRNIDGAENAMPSTFSQLMPMYAGWYIFLLLFIAFGIWHFRAQQKSKSVFDFAKYSLYSGDVHPFFLKLKISGRPLSARLIECLVEPAPFFIIGIPLWLMGQKLGILLMFSSFCYGITYLKDYTDGDNFIMDKIDEIICNEELEGVFVDDAESHDSRGFEFRGQKPDTQEMRRKILPLMVEDEEISVAK